MEKIDEISDKAHEYLPEFDNVLSLLFKGADMIRTGKKLKKGENMAREFKSYIRII